MNCGLKSVLCNEKGPDMFGDVKKYLQVFSGV